MSSRTKPAAAGALTGRPRVGTPISASVLGGTVTERSIPPSGRRRQSEATLPRTVSIAALTWSRVAGARSVSSGVFGTRLLTAADGMYGRTRSVS